MKYQLAVSLPDLPNLCFTEPPVRASAANRKASAASANPLMPSMLTAPGGGTGNRRGGGSDGPRRWLAAMGV